MRRFFGYLCTFGGMLLLLATWLLLSRPTGAPAAPAARAAAPQLTTTPSPTPGCTPGWTIYPNPAPPGESVLTGTTALAPNDMWAVGSYGSGPTHSLTVHGDGTTWTQVPSPDPGADNVVLSGVAGVAGNDVWAVGAYASGTYWQTLTEHWNGTAWTIVPSPNGYWGYNHLYGVVAIASNDVWAVGDSFSGPFHAYGLIEHWDGSSWSALSPPPNGGPRLNAVAAASATDVWAVGNGIGGISGAYVVHWNGSAWSVVASPSNGGGLYGVAALATNDVWAVGCNGCYSGGSGGQTMIEHWDGSAWSLVPAPNPGATANHLYGVSARASNDVWAVGDTDQAGGAVKTFALHWNGSGWFQVATPDNPTGRDHFYGVAAPGAPGGVVWAVGTYGCTSGCTQNALIARGAPACLTPVPTNTPTATVTPTPACGLDWRTVPNPGSGGLGSVAVVAANDIWAVGWGSPPLIEHWDGSSWSIVPSPPLPNTAYLNGVAAVAANDIWAVGDYWIGQSYTLVEHWDGSSWTIVPSPSPGTSLNGLTAVAAVAANDVWAVGGQQSNGVDSPLIEHWNGSTWSIVSGPNISGGLHGVAAVAADDIWAVGAYTNGALTMHWNGSSWSIVPSPPQGVLDGAVAVAANDVWAVGYSGAFGTWQTLTEHWNGTSWSIVPSPSPSTDNNTLSGVVALAGNDVWAVGYTFIYNNRPDYTLIEHWNGSSWSVVPGPATGGLSGVAAVAPNDLWAVGTRDNSALVEHYNDPCAGTGTPTRTPTRTATIVAPTHTVAPPSATRTSAPPTQTPGGPPSNTPTPPPTQTPGGPSATPRPPTATAGLPTATGTPCAIRFSDVLPTDYFYTPVQYLYCHGVISGYADNTFRPYNSTTRAQMVKIVVLGFALPLTTPSGGGYTFTDVQPDFPFYAVIETAAAHNIVSGYSCGGPGEPCDPQNRPYFRPYANVTRGQLSKIAVVAAGWTLLNPPNRSFEDVLPGTAFYEYIETAACHYIISGYACGSPGESCDPSHHPYFRPNNNVTRGQIAKIVYLAVTASGSCPGPP